MQNNLISIVKDYFDRVLLDVTGIKCLIMDRETKSIYRNKRYINFNFVSIGHIKKRCVFSRIIEKEI